MVLKGFLINSYGNHYYNNCFVYAVLAFLNILLLFLSLYSFISKTLSMLLNQRASIFLDYIQKTERFVDSFLQHLGTSAMMDLLLQMITAPDGDQHRTNLALVCYDIT